MRVIHGDCLDVMPTLDRVDAVVTDPPYGLTFMGRHWDKGVPGVEFWRQMFDLLPPGGWLLAFSGTRTYHRMACAIEDAGFEIRDQIQWLYGSGFPKSHNLDPFCRVQTRAEHSGQGTALKPACEPICMARKPLSGTVAGNVLEHGTGALNIDASRIEGRERTEYGLKNATRTQANVFGVPTDSADFDATKGRWPSNVLHDGSPEVMGAFALFGESESKAAPRGGTNPNPMDWGNGRSDGHIEKGHTDTGTAARFFYSAKADSADRLGSKHPTVKPVDLMAYLVRLVTPPGGTVLDPFAGSGTTGMACLREGVDCILIEREAEYIADINRRLDHVKGLDTPLFEAAR